MKHIMIGRLKTELDEEYNETMMKIRKEFESYINTIMNTDLEFYDEKIINKLFISFISGLVSDITFNETDKKKEDIIIFKLNEDKNIN